MTRQSLAGAEVAVGDELPALVVALTPTHVVAGALATRDFMPVHHDRDYANSQGAPDIFMNVISSTGYVTRFLTDWAGPDAMVKGLAVRLGIPAFPGSTLTVTGTVTAVSADEASGDTVVDIELRAATDLGDHVSGTATVSLPGSGVSASGLAGRAAIVGIGQTEFSKESGRTELQLACEAVKAALDDAGLTPADVDGLVTFTMDDNEEMEVARNLGIGSVRMFSRVHYGGGAAAGTVLQAAMAVATGVADVVVCYRVFNERSGLRFGDTGRQLSTLPPWLSWYAPFGLLTPASWVAIHAARYMHTYGVTNEDFGAISVVDRAHAATNPDAWFYERPITIEEHQQSRWVVEPVLRLLDCCQESDGGVALVVTSRERARDLRQPPAVIEAAAEGAAFDGEMMTSYYRDDITGLPEMGVVAGELWAQSGLSPADIDTAFLYDHFTPFVLVQLEELGFCGRGEAKDFATVENLSISGTLPINTAGGLLGEAYIHGMNGITEVVRQLRGTAVNQVDDVDHALVTAGTGVPTSGLILGRD